MKRADILALRQNIQQKASELARDLRVLVPEEAEKQMSILAICTYEASRKIEEFVHRVNDAASILMSTSEEAVAEAVDHAARTGQLRVVGGSNEGAGNADE